MLFQEFPLWYGGLGTSLQWLVLQWRCGFELWLDTMSSRMWRCPSSGVGYSCGSDSVTGPELPNAVGATLKRKKKKNDNNCYLGHGSKLNLSVWQMLWMMPD